MNLKGMMRAIWFCKGFRGRWGAPVLFEGPPGSSKSSRLESLAGEFDLPCLTLISSLRDPSDFLGLPTLGGEYTQYATPLWVHQINKAGGGVIFADELSTCPPAVQAALLRPILEGVVGETTLNHRVRWVAAQNSVADSAGGWDLAPPLANRFMHIPWQMPSVQDWSEYIMGANDNAADGPGEGWALREEARVEANWAKPYSIARGLLTSFLRKFPDLLHKMPKAGEQDKGGESTLGKAWPSPRSWEMATRVFASAALQGLGDVDSEELVRAAVGRGAATQFMTFRMHTDMPDPEEILTGKVKLTHDKKKADRTMAVLSSCAAFVMGTKEKPRQTELAEGFWDVTNTLVTTPNFGWDLAIPAASAMMKSPDVPKTGKAMQAACQTLFPVMQQGHQIATKIANKK